jgi:RNA polymerase sigma factor (sigma-70 family)
MDPADLFRANAALIDRIAASVCRRARVSGADAEDFAGDVRVALMEGDFAILREFAGRASLQSYLSIVIERLMFDQRTRAFGRWVPSAQAKRLGDAALLLEKLLLRDHRSFDEVLPFLRAAHPELSRDDVARLASQLPQRDGLRPRAVPLDEVVADTVPAADDAEERVMRREARTLAARAGEVIRDVMRELPSDDRMLLRFRFRDSMSIADISRMTRLPQRPLYRRIESVLGRLRSALIGASIDASSLDGVIGAACEMNFGLAAENETMMQSSTRENAP